VPSLNGPLLRLRFVAVLIASALVKTFGRVEVSFSILSQSLASGAAKWLAVLASDFSMRLIHAQLRGFLAGPGL
jgi:hypothetical protein